MSKSGRVFLFLCALGIQGVSGPAAAADLAQTLDSVDVYAPNTALKMRFDDARRDRYASSSEAFGIGVAPSSGRSLQSCVRAPNRDFVCLEDAVVRSWPDAEENLAQRDTPRDLFSCMDESLGLITRGNPCTAIAIDPAGTIWLAGRNRKSSFSLLKVVPVLNTSDLDNCPAPYHQFRKLRSSLANRAQGRAVSDYCVAEYATGRPALEDISYVGGDVGAAFVGPDNVRGPGVLLMEQRVTVSFVPDPEPRPGTTPFLFPVEPKVIGGTRSAWGLNRGEELQSAAVLQRDDAGGARLNYAVVATNQGRLLAKGADGLGDAFMVHDVIGNRRSTQCSPTAVPRFAVRTRYESDRAYVSDAACREVQALEPRVTPTDATCSALGGEFFFCNAREFAVSGSTSAPEVSTADKVDVTLATTSAETGPLEPIGLSVSPGIGINLNDCARTTGGTCVIVPDGNANAVGAQLSRVMLVDRTNSGLTMYQVVGMPDCRYPPHRVPPAPTAGQIAAFSPTQRLCYEANAVRTINGREFLDVSGLLPAEIRKLFDASTVPAQLPPMLVSPIYRARPENGYLFEAFFGRTEEGVTFRQTLNFEIDAPELTGKPQFDCGGATPGLPDLTFNVITTISERYCTGSGLAGACPAQPSPASPPSHVDMLVTTACSNPQSSAGTVRLSVFPYNLAVVPEAFTRNRYAPPAPVPPAPNYLDPTNDVYANLLVSLFDDLGLALDTTARVDIDGNAGGTAPLTFAAWQGLKSSWLNAEDKLRKCVGAAYDKRSAADQTCQAFFVQMSSFRAAAAATMPSGTDRANRVGELVGRSDVVLYVLGAHFLPSIPMNGFYRPDPL